MLVRPNRNLALETDPGSMFIRTFRYEVLDACVYESSDQAREISAQGNDHLVLSMSFGRKSLPPLPPQQCARVAAGAS